MTEKRQMSQSIYLAILLALAGGMLDAYTFLCRGGMFATAQTGNLVTLGICAAQGDFHRVFYYILSVIAFSTGIFTAELLTLLDTRLRLHWRQWGLLIECAILLAVAFTPNDYDLAVCLLVSYISAIQLETFRKFRGKNCATTMCTGNLRSASELIYNRMFKKGKPGAYVYYLTIGSFVLGAVCSGFLAPRMGNRTVLMPCIPLVLGFLLMFSEHEFRLNIRKSL